MGACTSKSRKNKEKHLKADQTNADHNNKKDSPIDQTSANNADQFANVPFIDSEDKLNTTTSSQAPPSSTEQAIPSNQDNDNDERTTVKTNFETNVSYSSAETIDKLKQEVYTFLREKIFPIAEEKQKLVDYVHKRIIGGTNDNTLIDQSLEQCFNDIQQHKHPDNDNDDKIKRRLMNIVTIYVASQSSDNSFLKALYDKMGPSLDLNSLNAETNEHEVVNVTVTKTVRQIFVDGSSALVVNSASETTTDVPNSVIHLENNEHHIPADLPDDIRRKAEQRAADETHEHNHTFEEEFPVDDPNVQHAATKIQAQFRGFKTRRELEKMKEKSDGITHSNQDESNYDDEQSRTPSDEYQKPSDISNAHQDAIFDNENISEEEKREQERAAVSIQAQFRGYKIRKHLRETSDDKQEKVLSADDDKPSSHFNDHHHNITSIDEMKTDKNGHSEQVHHRTESTSNSEPIQEHYDDFEIDDMSDPNLEKAATRIQASYRGYKTRKDLGSHPGVPSSGHEQDHLSSSTSSQAHEEHDNARNKNILSPSAEGNKVPAGEEEEEEDNAAAVRIQAAYRGYRVRKELEK
ncbi:unnamed protein product [Adineta ricciae]|uniref:Uncharacterized protein n=1 Tax=Adineta ricciae TaxID=249248 RepID=A0A813MUY0_ADIRI|nr:unnamed protein product [Adineta ricciae]